MKCCGCSLKPKVAARVFVARYGVAEDEACGCAQLKMRSVDWWRNG